MPDIFISYSRRNKDFVHRLFDSLTALKREVWVDWEDIPPTTDWWAEIRAGIDSSNVFVFVITPDSVRSEVCQQELNYALENKKRFIPVLYQEIVQPNDQKAMNPAISSHNWVYFRDQDDYQAALNTLNTAVDTDYDYVREHTRLLLRAREWDTKKRDNSFVLKGTELQGATEWLDKGMTQTPAPTELQVAYIAASRKAAQRYQRNLLTGVSVALIVSLILAIAAVVGFFQANEQRNRAERNAAISHSLALAADAQLESARSNNESAVALALESTAMTDPPTEARQILSDSVFAPGTLRVLQGHDKAVLGADFTPDGKLILSGSSDHTVRLWDAATGQMIRQMGGADGGHTDTVYDVAVSPDGKLGLSTAKDNTLRLWELSTGKELQKIPNQHKDGINHLFFSPDGKSFLTASSDTTLILWDVQTGKVLHTYGDAAAPSTASGHTNAVFDASFSPDGSQFLSSSQDGTVILWDTNGATIKRRYTVSAQSVGAVAFSPDGKTFVSASADGQLARWDVNNPGQPSLIFQRGHTAYVETVRFNHQGNRLVSASDDNSLILWDAQTGSIIQKFAGHAGPVFYGRFSPDGRSILTASSDKTMRLWDAYNGAITTLFAGHPEKVRKVIASKDGSKLISVSYQGIIVWDTKTQQPIRQFGLGGDGHTDKITTIALSPDESQLVSGSIDKSIILWDVATGKRIRTFDAAHQASVIALAFSPDGKTVASSAESPEKTILLWDATTGKKQAELSGHTDSVESVVFSPDGKTLLSGSDDNSLILWDLDKKAQIRVLNGHASQVLRVEFSPDGKSVLSGANDNRAILWDVSTGQARHIFEGHNGGINTISFRADGKAFLTGSDDQTLVLWDAESGANLRQLQVGDGVQAASFIGDATHAVVGTASGGLAIWDVTALSLDDVQRWAYAHRYVPEFGCGERKKYQLVPNCGTKDTFPTRTPFASTH